MRKPVGIALAALLLLGGYATADVYDRVPGILTLDRPTPLPTARASGPAPTLVPLPSPAASPTVLAGLDSSAPTPAPAKLAEVLDRALADPALGPSVGMSVRDARTGAELYARGADTSRVIASVQKLLAAAAITDELDPMAVMTTSVRQTSPTQLVLVAGGDTLLATGAGDPDAVAGRAGLRDLAEQVATALEAAGPVPDDLTVRLDTTYAAGPGFPDTPAYPTGWAPADVAAGYTQTVAMLGLAEDRPKPGKPSPSDPAAAVLKAFADELTRALTVSVGTDSDAATRTEATPKDAPVLGEVRSAAYQDVLGLALDESDNALTENLARQAAVRAGEDGSFAGNAAWVLARLKHLGFDVRGTTMLDTSGLARGQSATVDLVAEVTSAALTGKLPGLADAMAGLPIAGLDGTLFDRYLSEPASAAAGVVRAKTGTLTGISSLAGTTVDADDRELLFVVVADQVPAATGTLGARSALDRAIAELTQCGCR